MMIYFGNEDMQGESAATSLVQFRHVCKDLKLLNVGFPWGTTFVECLTGSLDTLLSQSIYRLRAKKLLKWGL